MFSGFLKCADCGKSVTRSQSGKNVYYACSTYKNRSRTACTMHSIKHNRLEAAVLFAIQYQVSTAVSYSEIVTRINAAPLKKSQSHRLNDQIAAKEKELTKITRYKQSLYQDWKDGEITQQEYREMKADYERQAAGLSDLLARLTAERKELSNGVDQQHPALVAFAKYQNIEKLTREILIELVDHIKVYENGNISVHFKFADEFRKIAEYIEINTTDTAEAGCPPPKHKIPTIKPLVGNAGGFFYAKEREKIKKYSVIYADPPWQYQRSKVQGAAQNHYPAMAGR